MPPYDRAAAHGSVKVAGQGGDLGPARGEDRQEKGGDGGDIGTSMWGQEREAVGEPAAQPWGWSAGVRPET